MLGRNAMGQGEIQYESLSRFFSLAEIQSSTNNFDDDMVIGIGGFGKVYKGYIDNGSTIVAIKRLNPESNQGADEFWTEVEMLSQLRYTHLVALIGYCNDCNEMILVYEYIAHGTLADHLYKLSKKGDGIGLTWHQRLNICIGAARGLDYLHTGTQQSFIHRDVKTTNILLDEKWVAKISDFGLSKGTTSFSKTHITTAVKGTFGFLDPDYFRTQRLTKKSDVYAFGVVMLEVLCGRPVVDTRLEEDQISLVFWARHCIETGRLSQIIDTSLRGQISPNALKCFVEIAYKCLHDRPQERPTMAEVVAGLEFALASQHGAIIDDDHHPHPATKATKKKRPSLMKRFETSITSAVDLFLASLHSNPPYNNNFMSNDGMFTTRVDPNRAPHHTSTSYGNNSRNQSYTSN